MVREAEMKDRREPQRHSRSSRTIVAIAVCVVAYLLSSGPVLATAFWLREATHWEGFYMAMWLYAPLLLLGPNNVMGDYIEWWVELFGTVGPG
jgi:hypothetical protein